MSKKRLGRGLDALLSDRKTGPENKAVAVEPAESDTHQETTPVGGQTETRPGEDGLMQLPVERIAPSPYQPRRHFDDEALADLANSIRQQGVLQPVVVRIKASGMYELIAGERRWRAAQRAGLSSIPAVVKSVTDEEASALALIENMQRENLRAMEEALGQARLRDEFELTQQQIADAVGKSRVAIANLLRLLNLGAMTRQLLEHGDLEMGHARALLALEGLAQDNAAQQVVDQGLSVRQAEALVRRLTSGDKPAPRAAQAQPDADTLRLQQRLTDHIGAPVSIKHGSKGGGEMTIKYSSLDELEGVLRHLHLPDE